MPEGEETRSEVKTTNVVSSVKGPPVEPETSLFIGEVSEQEERRGQRASKQRNEQTTLATNLM